MSAITGDEQSAAEAVAMGRFKEAAETYRSRLEEAWHEALPGNHTRAEAVLLAHLMTAHDGYNDLVFVEEWERRPRDGWQTAISYLAAPVPQLTLSFAFESRYGGHSRQLAIFVDGDRPGERTPAKQRNEQLAVAQGFRVLVLTDLEIIHDADACRERVENILFEMIEDAMIDAEILTPRHSRTFPIGPLNDN